MTLGAPSFAAAVCLAFALPANLAVDSTDFVANVGVPRGKPIAANRIKTDGDLAARATLKPSNCVPYDGNTRVVFRYQFADAVIFSGFRFKSLVEELKSAAQHGRVQSLLITTDGGTARVDLRDTLALTPIDSERQVQVGRPIPTSTVLLSPVRTKTLVIAVQSVYAGTKFNDVCFSDFAAYESRAEPYRGPPTDYE